MVLDGKAVGLLLDLADEGEHRRDGLDADLPAVRVDQGPSAVAVVLHHAVGGDGQIQHLQHPGGHLHMLVAAVNEEQVGLVPELLVAVQIPAEAAGEHLFHGGIVVGAVHVLQLEAAVVPLEWPAVHIDHHGGHYVAGPGVGDVVGLHPPGRTLQAEHFAQGLQQLVPPLFVGGGPLHLLPGVLVGQLDQVHLGPPLGGDQLHPVPHLLGQHPGEGHLVGQLAGDQNLLGEPGAAHVVLPHQGGQYRPLLVLHGGLQQVEVLGGQLAVHEVENYKGALGRPPEEAGHVGVGQGAGNHLLPLAQQLDGPEPVPELSRPLKPQLLRRPLHLLGQVLLHVLEPALQQRHRLGDGLVVLLLQLVPPAVAVTFAHMEVEAGPLLADVPGELFIAGGQAQGGFQGVNDALGTVPAGVGTEVPGPVLRRLGGQREPGVRLLGQADVGVALSVLKKDVVPGLVPLDEGALQYQGLELAVGDDDVEVVDLRDHSPGLLRVGGGVLKILAHPVFQRLGLAHIDYGALGVLHDVDARLQREAAGLLF